MVGGSEERDIASWYVKDNKAMDSSAKSDSNISASDKVVTSAIRVKDETALYILGSGGDQEHANCTIEVGTGGEMRVVNVPTIKDYENVLYPAHFNNNAVYLGCYGNETVDVRVTMDGNKGEYFDVDIIGISVDAMKSLSSTYSGIDEAGTEATGSGLTIKTATEISGMSAEGNTSDQAVTNSVLEVNYVNRLLLPVTYDKGFTITVNGKRVKGASYAGLFTLIPLEEGANTVRMNFIPPGMIAGSLITLVTAALIAAYAIMMRIRKESLSAVLQKPESIAEPVLFKMYIGVFAAAVLFIYIIPVFYGIYSLVSGR